jgi:hypothetical protein
VAQGAVFEQCDAGFAGQALDQAEEGQLCSAEFGALVDEEESQGVGSFFSKVVCITSERADERV